MSPEDESDKSCFVNFRRFLFLLRLLLLDFLFVLSLGKSDLLDHDSDDDGSDSGSSGTYSFTAFSVSFDDSTGRVSGLGSGIFVRTGVDPKCDILSLLCSYQLESNKKAVDS